MFCLQNNLNLDLIIHLKGGEAIIIQYERVLGARCQGSRSHADNTCKVCALFYTLLKANSARLV